jgi:hypothetical protein
MARVLKYLASATRRRPAFEEQELDELENVLGSRPASLAAGRTAFADAVRSGGVGLTDALPVIHYRVGRENELLRDASGALADRHYVPLF